MSQLRFVVLVMVAIFFVACGNEGGRKKYVVTIDNKSMEDMVLDGHYQLVWRDINSKNFPITGKGIYEADIGIVHFNRNISTNSVVEELDRVGMRPARIEELLAFGAKYPDLQRYFSIIALGSSYFDADNFPVFPTLYAYWWYDHRQYRGIGTSLGDGPWRRYSRFLAVRK